jgi:hypothetical protein
MTLPDAPTRFVAICPPKSLRASDGGVKRASIEHGLSLETMYGVGLSARRREVNTGFGVAAAWSDNVTGFSMPVSVCRDQHLLVAFQGALSNRSSLCEHLSVTKGVTKSDAELVAMLSLEHPEKPHNVLAKLRGTYSFVVVDTAHVRIFASRDPSGTSPLFLVRSSWSTRSYISPHAPQIHAQDGAFTPSTCSLDTLRPSTVRANPRRNPPKAESSRPARGGFRAASEQQPSHAGSASVLPSLSTWDSPRPWFIGGRRRKRAEGGRGWGRTQYRHTDGAVVVTNFAATAVDPILSQLSVEHTQEMEAGTLVFGHHAVQRGYTHKVRLLHPYDSRPLISREPSATRFGAPTRRKNAGLSTTPLPAQLQCSESYTISRFTLTSPTSLPAVCTRQRCAAEVQGVRRRRRRGCVCRAQERQAPPGALTHPAPRAGGRFT